MPDRALGNLNDAKTTVVLAGAGFSIDAGQVLTRDILRKAPRVPIFSQTIPMLERYLQRSDLLKGPLADEDIENLLLNVRSESTFIASVFPETLSFGDGRHAIREEEASPADAHRALGLIYWVMVSGIYEPGPYFETNPWIDWGMSGVYRKFCRRLPPRSVILTTNYDDILERGLVASKRSWTYGAPVVFPSFMKTQKYELGNGSYYIRNVYDLTEEFHEHIGGGLIWARADWRPSADTQQEAEIVLCKLHGGFRWIQCRDCSRTYSVDWWAAYPIGDFIGYAKSDSDEVAFRCWNGECAWIPRHVAILPAEDKTLGWANPIIDEQWETARRAAIDCGKLVIIGSSLRAADERILELIRQASAGAQEVVVVDPFESAARRAEEISGKAVEHVSSLKKLVRSGYLQ